MSKMDFNDQQKTAIAATSSRIVVSAGAGSGKTAVLTQRIVTKLAHRESPVDIDHFIVVTYTKAAAAEMRSRISEKLSDLVSENAHDPVYCNQLRKQIGKLSNAKIQTVHSFCLDLLRKNCNKLGLPAVFDLCSEDELDQMQEFAALKTLEQAYEANSEDFSALRAAVCEERGDNDLSKAIIKAYNDLQSLPYPEKWLRDQIENYDKGSSFLKEESDRAVADECLRMIKNTAADITLKLEHLKESCPDAFNAAQKSFTKRLEIIDMIIDLLSAHDFNGVLDLIKNMPKIPNVDSIDGVYDLEKKAVAASREGFNDTIKAISDMLKLPEDDETVAKAEKAFCQLCLDFGKILDDEKKRASRLTYSDLEHLTIKLLSNEDGSPSDIALGLREYYLELMVDEYQDSNKVQDTIFDLIAPKDGSSFFVGDIKQSIYRFIRANPKIFAERCKRAEKDSSSTYVTMNDNYRSTPQVIDLTNDFFSKIMTESFGDVNYASKGQPLASHRDSAFSPCEFCMIDVKSINEQRRADDLGKLSTAEAESRYIAQRIKEMIGVADVPDKDKNGNPIIRKAKAGDFAILLSSYQTKCDEYINALAELGIPYSASRREKEILSTTEASVIISLLRIISNRRQDIPLLSIMRSPIFNFSMEEIAAVRAKKRRGDIWDAVLIAANEGDKKCQSLISEIDHYCNVAKDTSCSRLLQHIYTQTGAYGVFSSLPQPKERKRTLDFIYRAALQCEGGGFASCDKLVAHLDRLADAEVSSVTAKGGVNLMSIHKSKGLEFPFVFVADQNKTFNLKDANDFALLLHSDIGLSLSYVDKKYRLRIPTRKHKLISSKIKSELLSEELRKLYVAMTRARERLFLIDTIPGNSSISSKIKGIYSKVGKKPSHQWLAEQKTSSNWLISIFMTHPGAEALRAVLPTATFGIDSDNSTLECKTVYSLTDPAPDLSAAPVFEDYNSPSTEARFEQYLDLMDEPYPYEGIAKLSSKMTPTGMGGHTRIVREIYTAAEATDGLTAAEKGTRVHDLLAKVDLAQCRTLEGSRAQLEKFSLGGEAPDERDIEMVCSFANSPWGERVLSAKEVMHEYRFGLLFTPKELDLGDNETEQILVNGSIDLLLDEGDSLTVVDYKTDSVKPGEEKAGAEVHRRQLELYKNAAQQIFQKPVSEITVFFLKTGVGIKL